MVPSKAKNSLSRRSSILKPPKVRHVLQDANQSSNENSPTTKIKRRVSFAEKKHVKKFCDSIERGTIWDHSYEENDSSHPKNSSVTQEESIKIVTQEIAVQQNHGEEVSTSNVIYKRVTRRSTSKIPQSSNSNRRSISYNTTNATIIGEEERSSSVLPKNHLENPRKINFKKKVVRDAPRPSLPSNVIQEKTDNNRNASRIPEIDNDISSVICFTKKPQLPNMSMEMTNIINHGPIIQGENSNISCTKIFDNEPMAITENLPSINYMNDYRTVVSEKNSVVFTETMQTITSTSVGNLANCELDSSFSSIEETIPISSTISKNVNGSGRSMTAEEGAEAAIALEAKIRDNVINSNCSTYTDNLDSQPNNDTMELTCTSIPNSPLIPGKLHIRNNGGSSTSLRKMVINKSLIEKTKIFFNDSIDTTRAIQSFPSIPSQMLNSLLPSSTALSRCQSQVNYDTANADTRPIESDEETHQKNQESEKTLCYDDTSMELTGVIPTVCTSESLFNFNTMKTQVHHDKPTETFIADQSSRKIVTQNLDSTRTQVFEDMPVEMTCAIPSIREIENRDLDSSRTQVFENMPIEMTCAIPSIRAIETQDLDSSRTQVFDDMPVEMTCAIPSIRRNENQNLDSSKTQLFNDMPVEMTTAIQGIRAIENQDLDSSRTYVFDDMPVEMTCAIPSMHRIDSKNLDSSRTQVFDDMPVETTCAVPSIRKIENRNHDTTATQLFNDMPVEMTTAIQGIHGINRNLDSSRTQVFENMPVEMTCAVPSIRRIENRNLDSSETQVFEDMPVEMTCAVPSIRRNENQNLDSSKTQLFNDMPIEMTTAIQGIRAIENQDLDSSRTQVFDDMPVEMTCAIPSIRRIENQNLNTSKTQVFDNMPVEITCGIPSIRQSETNHQNLINTVCKNTESSVTQVFHETSMEMTSAVPPTRTGLPVIDKENIPPIIIEVENPPASYNHTLVHRTELSNLTEVEENSDLSALRRTLLQDEHLEDLDGVQAPSFIYSESISNEILPKSNLINQDENSQSSTKENTKGATGTTKLENSETKKASECLKRKYVQQNKLQDSFEPSETRVTPHSTADDNFTKSSEGTQDPEKRTIDKNTCRELKSPKRKHSRQDVLMDQENTSLSKNRNIRRETFVIQPEEAKESRRRTFVIKCAPQVESKSLVDQIRRQTFVIKPAVQEPPIEPEERAFDRRLTFVVKKHNDDIGQADVQSQDEVITKSGPDVMLDKNYPGVPEEDRIETASELHREDEKFEEAFDRPKKNVEKSPIREMTVNHQNLLITEEPQEMDEIIENISENIENNSGNIETEDQNKNENLVNGNALSSESDRMDLNPEINDENIENDRNIDIAEKPSQSENLSTNVPLNEPNRKKLEDESPLSSDTLDVSQPIYQLDESISKNPFDQLVEELRTESNKNHNIWSFLHNDEKKRLLVFGFMGESLWMAVYLSEFDRDAQLFEIRDIKFLSRLTGNSGLIAKLIHRLLLDKIQVKSITDEFRDSTEIHQLLQFVSDEVKLVMDFKYDLKKLEGLNALEINLDRISFIARTNTLNTIIKVFVTLKPFDKIDPTDVVVHRILGSVVEQHVKDLIINVRKDHLFLRRFMCDVHDYIELMEH